MSPSTDSDLRSILAPLATDAASVLPILDLVLSSIGDGVAIANDAGNFIYLNAAARRILGVAPDGQVDLRAPGAELYYLNDFSPIPTDELPLVRALRGEELKDIELFARGPGVPEGALICLNARPIREANGRVRGGVAVLRDVGARKKAEDDLQAANSALGAWVAELERRATMATLTNEMANLLQSCRSTKEFYYVASRFAGRIFERQPGAIFLVNASRSAIEMVTSWGAGVPSERVFAPDACWALRRGRIHDAGGQSTAPDCEHVASAVAAGYRCIPMMGHGEALGVLHVHAHTDDPGPASEIAAAVADARLKATISVAEHIALALANLKLRETLRMQAIRDPLTGLFNRRYMEESLEREIARATRAGGSISAVMIDIDHFKRFNDTFGHAAADVALRETASLILANLRAEDIACRFGGEEIVLILPDATASQGASRAERLRVAMSEQQLRYQGVPIGAITASFGVAAYPAHGKNAESLLRAADEALYRAKDDGRNRVCVKEPAARDGAPPVLPGPSTMPAFNAAS